jgi:hypothetical protein
MLISRYKGFSTLLDSFRRLGLLSSEPVRGVESWDQFLTSSTRAIVGQDVKKGDMGSVMKDILGSRQRETEDALRWSVIYAPGAEMMLITQARSSAIHQQRPSNNHTSTTALTPLPDRSIRKPSLSKTSVRTPRTRFMSPPPFF